MNLPIDFKYVSIDKGRTQPMAEGDKEVRGYVLTDKEKVVIASGTSLPDLFEYALTVDGRFERMYQFTTRGKLEQMEHLEDIDIDKERAGAIPGFAMPKGPEGGAGGAPPMH